MTTPHEPTNEEIQAVKNKMLEVHVKIYPSGLCVSTDTYHLIDHCAKWHLSEVAALKKQIDGLKKLLQRHHRHLKSIDKLYVASLLEDDTLTALEKGSE